ncbi:hypothetical protein V9K97_22105 [Variovorax sp. CCNWLW186]|uniref:hypothetical protein n=1 Tax=Variovorax sp. CCNWLW186 TaxID=3127473 RepID=UPI00307793A7
MDLVVCDGSGVVVTAVVLSEYDVTGEVANLDLLNPLAPETQNTCNVTVSSFAEERFDISRHGDYSIAKSTARQRSS